MSNSLKVYLTLVGVAILSASYLLFNSQTSVHEKLFSEKLQIRKIKLVTNEIIESYENKINVETNNSDKTVTTPSTLSASPSLEANNPYATLKQESSKLSIEELRIRKSQKINDYFEIVLSSKYHPLLTPNIENQVREDSQSVINPYRLQKSNNPEPPLFNKSIENKMNYFNSVVQLVR